MAILNIQKMTSLFQKMTIFIFLLSLNLIANEQTTLGITGVALKKDVSTLIELKNYLIKKTNLKIKIKFARSYSSMRHLILDGDVNIAYICGATYVDLLPSKLIKLMVLPIVNKKPYYYSLIIAKNGTKYRKIDDFKNSIFAMRDPESNSGSLVARYKLDKKGYKDNHFFKKIIYTYDHGESITAVIDGYVNGASVDSVVYFSFLKNYPKLAKKLKIVEKFGPYPIPPFILRKSLPKQEQIKLTNAFLGMQKDKEGKKILSALAIQRFSLPNNLSYKKIKEIKKYLADFKYDK
ncbi:MAG: phosphate/phosphite/phosphonate ABC transporter substrate-binding protein [Campylobacteraceae bacterium]|nr:phosphate/phosphite/phosphonate ABC transporter substrate-binding protein [Campylobacteraceae bacterium]